MKEAKARRAAGRLDADGPLGWVRELLGHGSLISISSAAQMAGTVVALPILTRLMSSDEYGSVVTALLVGQVLAIPAAVGIPAAVAPLFYDDAVSPEGVRRSYLAVPVAAVVVCGLATVASPVWTPIVAQRDLTATLALGLWSAVPLACLATSQAILLAARRSAAFSAHAAVSTLGAQVVGIAAIALTGGGPERYVQGVVVVTALAAVASARAAGITLRAQPQRDALVRAWRVGLPTVPHLLALQIMGAGDRAVIARRLSLEDVGRYQVAYAVGSVGIAVFGAFTQAVAPMVHAAPSDAERYALLARMSSLLHRMAALLVAAVALAAPIGIELLAPASYDRAALRPVAATIALSAIAWVFYVTAVNVLFQEQRSGVLAIASPAAAVLNIVLNIVLVDVVGLVGAALVTVATYAALGIAVWASARRLAHVPWDWRTIAISWAVAVAAATFGAVVPFDGLWIVARAVAAIGALAVAAQPLVRLLQLREVRPA